VKQITTRRTIVSIVTVALFAWQLAGCAVLPERMSGFKEPTLDQQSNLDAATKYAQDVNGELLSLHDQYAVLEAALIAGALGSGIAFGIATAFNGSKDLLAALGLAGGGLVAIDYASSAPQKIKVINEGRSEISCALATAPRLRSATPAPANPNGDVFGLAQNPYSSAQQELLNLAQTLRARPATNPNADAVAAASTSSTALGIVSTQLTTTAANQNADFKAAVLQVSLVAPTPAQYLTDTASDVAHSVFDLLDQANPSVSDVFNKGKSITPQSSANAHAAVNKAAATTQQAKSLVSSVQNVAGSPAADVANPVATSAAASDASQKLDSNAQTLSVLNDILQKVQNCKNFNSQAWNVTE